MITRTIAPEARTGIEARGINATDRRATFALTLSCASRRSHLLHGGRARQRSHGSPSPAPRRHAGGNGGRRGDLFQQARKFHNADGVEHDHARAFVLFKKAADLGHAQAQVEVARMYLNGDFVSGDDAEAFQWFRKAAKQKHPRAIYYLGQMYQTGRGVVRDTGEAFLAYREAARLGEALAQTALGRMYHDGGEISKDYAEALKFFRLAAEKGQATAQRYLGEMHLRGDGIERDEAEAHRWFVKAANQGDSAAQISLGTMYESGQFVAKSYAKAAALFRKAAAQGIGNAWEKLMDMAVEEKIESSRAELHAALESVFGNLANAIKRTDLDSAHNDAYSVERVALALQEPKLAALAGDEETRIIALAKNLKTVAKQVHVASATGDRAIAEAAFKKVELVVAGLRREFER